MKLAVLAISVLLCCTANASAATLHLVGNFDQPIFVTSDPADPNRLFVVERKGKVAEIGDGGGLIEFADLTALVSCCESERGLLSIALAPDFDASGRFYAAYTGKPAAGGTEGDIHVDAFHHEGAALVREPLFAVGHSANANHNGGQLELGPDGYLYVSTGDGGGEGDAPGNSQNPGSLLGKILRIEPRPGATPEIWSSGLRNPWRFSFDRANGDMVIGDVGQGVREEVDFAPSPVTGVVAGSGVNYGWNCREGFIAYSGGPGSCAGAGPFTDPAFDYPHTDPGEGKAHGCAITGGYVVRDPSLGDLYGRYMYVDFCAGEIRSLALPAAAGGLASDDRSEGLKVASPVSFGEDSCRRLYVVAQGGAVYRVEGTVPAGCPKPLSASPGSVASATQTTGAPRPRSSRIFLRARRHRLGRRLELILTVRVLPCAGQVGSRVQLNRGGKRIATRQLDPGCIARFSAWIARRSTFRALLDSGGYRSQVLTIALAKPRP